jgi:hypothetical protein
MAVVTALLLTLRTWLHTRAELQLEKPALRLKLQVLSRTAGRRARLAPTARLLWTWFARVWRAWQAPLIIVKPETVIAWQPRGFQAWWTWRSRRRVVHLWVSNGDHPLRCDEQERATPAAPHGRSRRAIVRSASFPSWRRFEATCEAPRGRAAVHSRWGQQGGENGHGCRRAFPRRSHALGKRRDPVNRWPTRRH